ncbi:zinc finger protein 264 isoform X1 [Tribolium castaneum]|uniref:Transcription factor Ken-like Protein n=1 Tax=Tribolium castaneum TaxID=7070 RepID=D2A125_TRICA|nr:PREDICTED: zinc finger protein 264 isoform X1 [Tribolium castaneum]EFA02595.1 Transcription factor Ken-like Protein [Tribolium castaneum]|eukprot:XP_008192634.1 PREDICTED: zinc finger protein 264 isoform X1 [Tribolium castaneum]
MQALQDFVCSECKTEFHAAAALLQHFALHASNCLINSMDKGKPTTLKKLPDLYPIHFKKKPDSDVESDSGIEDVNPIKFCLVTMVEEAEPEKIRKYQCKYCSKKFGWPTDLKRHILIHTGERPFKCQCCDSTFTRNFLLKKHQRKCHGPGDIPDLKPIKSRKQEKSKIKRVMAEDM